MRLVVIMSGREGKTGYGDIPHAPVVALPASCMTQPMAQITGQHGNARHGQERHRGHAYQQADR